MIHVYWSISGSGWVSLLSRISIWIGDIGNHGKVYQKIFGIQSSFWYFNEWVVYFCLVRGRIHGAVAQDLIRHQALPCSINRQHFWGKQNIWRRSLRCVQPCELIFYNRFIGSTFDYSASRNVIDSKINAQSTNV